MKYSLVPSLYSQNSHFVNTNKKLLKNGNLNFPEARYFTQNLGFLSNILSMLLLFGNIPDNELLSATSKSKSIDVGEFLVAATILKVSWKSLLYVFWGYFAEETINVNYDSWLVLT